MSLIRLLAAGSSLRGIKDHPSPYKMTQEQLLPKFGSIKPTEAQEPVLASIPVLPPDPLPAAKPVRMAAAMAASPGSANKATGADATAPSAPPALSKSSPFLRWARGKNPFQPKRTLKKGAVPVQGELLLERVRVVRNDLNETDLEVVPATRRPEATLASTPDGASPEAVRHSWRGMVGRLFGRRP